MHLGCFQTAPFGRQTSLVVRRHIREHTHQAHVFNLELIYICDDLDESFAKYQCANAAEKRTAN